MLRKFFKLVPIPTLVVVVLTLVSQFSKLFAFFLPLKVIILIGSQGTPDYLSESWEAYGEDSLVIILSLIAMLCYFSYLASEKVLGMMVERGVGGVVSESRKLVLFSDQDEVACQAYQKLSSNLATGVLAGLSCLMFAVFYPAFLGAMLLYIVFASALLSVMGARKSLWRKRLHDDARGVIDALAGAGFLFLFAFMVMDFMYWQGVGFIVAIISLLLSRQLFNRVSSMVKDSLWLHGKHHKINSIFLSGYVLPHLVNAPQSTRLWELLFLIRKPERLLGLIEHMLGRTHEYPVVPEEVSCRWRQSAVFDVLLFDVELYAHDGTSKTYLLKVFGIKHKKLALNEADLLMSDIDNKLPSLSLLGATVFEGHEVHLFQLPHGMVAKEDRTLASSARLVGSCWRVEPGKELVARYKRSHPFLHQRMSKRVLDRLFEVVSDASPQAHLRELAESFGDVLNEIGKLPLAVLNSDVPQEMIFIGENEELRLAHWGNWLLEPLGTRFPMNHRWSDHLEEAFSMAAESRQELKLVPLDRVKLCVVFSHFEMRFKKQKYTDAVELIPDVMAFYRASKAKGL